MSKVITIKDCEELAKKFVAYTETAEQHEFATLVMIQSALLKTMRELRKAGEVTNQKEARAMFRVVLSAIGEDITEYKEDGV